MTQGDGSAEAGLSTDPIPLPLERPALFDTAVWTWARDRRFPQLAAWFNDAARSGLVLTCDLVVLELVHLAPNQDRARQIAERLALFEQPSMDAPLWSRAREVQLLLADAGAHRRVPPADLLIAAAAEAHGIAVVHYDRDYERIGSATGQETHWFVADGSLA